MGIVSRATDRSAQPPRNGHFPTTGSGGITQGFLAHVGCGSSTPGPHEWCIRQRCSGAWPQASEAGQQALGLPAGEFLARGGVTRTPFCV